MNAVFTKYKVYLIPFVCFFIGLLIGVLTGYLYKGFEIQQALRKAFSTDIVEKNNDTTTKVKVKNTDITKVTEAPKTKSIGIGESFESDGIKYTILNVERSPASNVDISDDIDRDSKIGIHLELENVTSEDKYFNRYFNTYNISLYSRTEQNTITTVYFISDNQNFQPELESQTLIDGAKANGWITYFLPSRISNDDLRFTFDDYKTTVNIELTD